MAKNPVNNLSVDVRTTTGRAPPGARAARDEVRWSGTATAATPAPRTQRARLRRGPAQVGHQRRADPLDIEGTEQLALTKAIEVHPIRRNIQHADLLVVRREKVTVEVNVHLGGDAASGTLVTRTPPAASRSRPMRCRSRSS